MSETQGRTPHEPGEARDPVARHRRVLRLPLHSGSTAPRPARARARSPTWRGLLPYSLFFFLIDSLVVWRIVNWFNAKVRYADILPIRGSATSSRS